MQVSWGLSEVHGAHRERLIRTMCSYKCAWKVKEARIAKYIKNKSRYSKLLDFKT